ncbi:MAG: pseudouridine-5-phosphate glycosidase [Tenericutes bacterium GWE2_38_8]|nr:MAG: pseudouridine-5-phosphate glycosidase [Tenericutes bacterium GWD2_38_27]OHE37547.1 MAG: pseudouridine-5-phosphate glycosidase [Tenericutes bacterium GWE2_38_8]HBG33575.1 pseudouridine-5-phosphate glycosidase [Acholeplasmataceae bacterium]
MNPYINIHPEVIEALLNNKPVVALESTIISHGMPYPENVNMALKVEEIIRSEGAVPATIAILNGIIKVGLTHDEIEFLAKEKDVLKVSKRDFGFTISQKRTGATTVSATMLVAKMAGIKIFATGGIGGVHRGAQETFDISRDLEELANVDVAVVCAGAKSILDLGLTLEYLETKGVEVLGYQTKELPAFYSRESGFELDYNMSSPKEIAALLHAKWSLGLTGGAVIANPIPKEFSMDSKKINHVIDQALSSASDQGIKGKDTTPYLLSKVKEMTHGESLAANLELVYNNARLAAKIAKEYTKL